MFGRTRTEFTRLLLAFLLLLCSSTCQVKAILPTAEVIITNGQNVQSFLASQASFGGHLSQDTSSSSSFFALRHTDSLLCQNVTSTSNEFQDSIVLVPRGECTYQHKAFVAQQMGAKGIVIYNTLASRYSLNTTTATTNKQQTSIKDIIFPQPFLDYDCQMLGSVEIPTSDIQFSETGVYQADHNDPLLSGETSACQKLQNCPSKRCLLTNYTPTELTTKACCAWDLHLWLYGDDSDLSVTIPAVFVTMEQAAQIKKMTSDATTVQLKARWKPTYNPSSFLVWLLGVVVAAVAAFQSAGDYHVGIAKLTQRRLANVEDDDDDDDPEPLARRNPMQEETVELEPIHALGFIAMASTSLFILFYFKVRLLFHHSFHKKVLTHTHFPMPIRFTILSRSFMPLDAAMRSFKF